VYHNPELAAIGQKKASSYALGITRDRLKWAQRDKLRLRLPRAHEQELQINPRSR
jgi:hypothetical protein